MIQPPNAYFLEAEARQAGALPVWIITLDDTYEVPLEDILDPGEIALARPYEFTDMASGSYTCILDNSTGKYSPRRSDFVLGQGVSWYRKGLTVELGYRRWGSEAIDKVLLFDGIILDWEVAQAKDFDAAAPYQGLVVTLTCQDHMYLLQERLVGTPTAAGELQPLVYGTVVKDALPLQDNLLWAPDFEANAETGDTSEWPVGGVVTAGAGTFAASTTEAYEGSYSFKADITAGGAADEAYGYTNLLGGIAVTNVIHSCHVKFTSIPGVFANRVPFFMGYVNSAGTDVINLGTSVAGVVQMYVFGPGVVDCELSINDIADRWVRLTIGADLAVPGTVRVYVDGNVVGQIDGNYAFTVAKAYYGFKKSAAVATGWTAYFDNCIEDEAYYPLGYYLPGAPYTSINAAYRDGVIIPEQAPKYWHYRQNRAGFAQGWTRAVYGRYVSNSLYTPSATYGFVAFSDLSDPPSGAIFIDATYDTTTHPVDMVAGILGEVDLDDRIDAANFAAAKAARPDDVVGCWFEDISAAAAISEINGKALMDLVERQGEFALLPYTGAPPAAAELTLNVSNCYSMTQAQDATTVQTVVDARYAWFEHDAKQSYRAQDAALIAEYGEQYRELNYAYGQPVMTSDPDMAAAQAELLLTRSKKPREILTCSGFLDLARLELGDGVLVDNELLSDEALIYEVFAKTVSCTSRTVTLTVARFLGEEA